jgi:hypothetical protein
MENAMPHSEKTSRPNLKRPESIKVMLSAEESAELQAAAERASMGLSVFVRAMALEAARRREQRAA